MRDGKKMFVGMCEGVDALAREHGMDPSVPEVEALVWCAFSALAEVHGVDDAAAHFARCAKDAVARVVPAQAA